MPLNALTLDPKNPAFAEALKNCKAGDMDKQLLVTFNVTQHGQKFVADVTKAEYPEMEEESEETVEEGGEEYKAEEKMTEKPMPKGPKVAIILAGGPRK